MSILKISLPTMPMCFCMQNNDTLHVCFAIRLMISDYLGTGISVITLSVYCMNEVKGTFLISQIPTDELTSSRTYSSCVAEPKMFPLTINPVVNSKIERILLDVTSSVDVCTEALWLFKNILTAGVSLFSDYIQFAYVNCVTGIECKP